MPLTTSLPRSRFNPPPVFHNIRSDDCHPSPTLFRCIFDDQEHHIPLYGSCASICAGHISRWVRILLALLMWLRWLRSFFHPHCPIGVFLLRGTIASRSVTWLHYLKLRVIRIRTRVRPSWGNCISVCASCKSSPLTFRYHVIGINEVCRNSRFPVVIIIPRLRLLSRLSR